MSGVSASFVTGVIQYTGDLKDGQFHGSGELQYYTGMKYKGSLADGCINGVGSFDFQDGSRYEGDVVRNVIDGFGSYRWPSGAAYFGEVSRGQRHGYGVYVGADGSRYEGRWMNGKRHGLGKVSSEDGTYYIGEWAYGKRCGWGIATWPSKAHYVGQWKDNLQCGYGQMTWLHQHVSPVNVSGGSNTSVSSMNEMLEAARLQTTNVGTVEPTYPGPYTPALPKFTHTFQRYEGLWQNGNMEGYGSYYWMHPLMKVSDDTVMNCPYQCSNAYHGGFVQGKRCGFGVLRAADGTVIECTWQSDIKQGSGVIRSAEGVEEQVEFVDDETTTRRVAVAPPPVEGGNKEHDGKTPPSTARGAKKKLSPSTAAASTAKPEATDVSLVNVTDLIQVDEDAADVLPVLRSLRNRLNRYKPILVALYTQYSAIECPFQMSSPHENAYQEEPQKDLEIRQNAFDQEPTFVKEETNKSLSVNHPKILKNTSRLERMLIMLESCAEDVRHKAVTAGNAALEKVMTLQEHPTVYDHSGSRAGTATSSHQDHSPPSTAFSEHCVTPGPRTAGGSAAPNDDFSANPFSFGYIPTPPLPQLPNPDNKVLRLWQVWDMLYDGELITPTLSLAFVDSMLKPLLEEQRKLAQDSRSCNTHYGTQEISFSTFTEFLVRLAHRVMTYNLTTVYTAETQKLSLDVKFDLFLEIHFGDVVSAARALTVSGVGPSWGIPKVAQDSLIQIPDDPRRSRPQSRKEQKSTAPPSAGAGGIPRPPSVGSNGSGSSQGAMGFDSNSGQLLSSTTMTTKTNVTLSNKFDPNCPSADAAPTQEEKLSQATVVKCSLEEKWPAAMARHLCIAQKVDDRVLFCGLRLERSLAVDTRKATRERAVLREDQDHLHPGMEPYASVLDIALPLAPRYLMRMYDFALATERHSRMLHTLFLRYADDAGVMGVSALMKALHEIGVLGSSRNRKSLNPPDALLRQILSQVLEVDVDWSIVPRLIYTDPFYTSQQQMTSQHDNKPNDPEKEKLAQKAAMRPWIGKEEVALHGTQIALSEVVLLYPQFVQSLLVVGHALLKKQNQLVFTVSTVLDNYKKFLSQIASVLQAEQTSHSRCHSVVSTEQIPPVILPARGLFKPSLHRLSITDDSKNKPKRK